MPDIPKDFSAQRTGEYIKAKKKMEKAIIDGNDAEAERWKQEMNRIANKDKSAKRQPLSTPKSIIT